MNKQRQNTMIKKLNIYTIQLTMSEGNISFNDLMRRLNRYQGVEICSVEMLDIIKKGPSAIKLPYANISHIIAYDLGLKSYYPDGFKPGLNEPELPPLIKGPLKKVAISMHQKTTGYPGIYYLPKSQKWSITIFFGKYRKYLGLAKTLLAAITLHNIEAKKLGKELYTVGMIG